MVEPETPSGAMHSVRCREEANGVVYCADPNMRNIAPVVHAPLPDLSVGAGRLFRHELAADCFLDRQSDGRMSSAQLRFSLSVTNEPGRRVTDEPHVLGGWLHFDEAARALHGTPPAAGSWVVTVTATDEGFRKGADPPLAASSSFLLSVREATVDTGADYWRDDGRNPTQVRAEHTTRPVPRTHTPRRNYRIVS